MTGEPWSIPREELEGQTDLSVELSAGASAVWYVGPGSGAPTAPSWSRPSPARRVR